MNRLRRFGITVFLFLGVACGATFSPAQDPVPYGRGERLRYLGPPALLVGAMMDRWALENYQYKSLAQYEYEIVTVPLYPFEFHTGFNAATGVSTYTYDARMDNAVQFLAGVGTKYHAHTLVGRAIQNPTQFVPGGYEPSWMANWNSFTPQATSSMLDSRISSFLERYGAKLSCVDVVNEAIADNATLPVGVWSKLGTRNVPTPAGGTITIPNYIIRAFQKAAEVRGSMGASFDLIYNDYGVETINAKSNAMFKMCAYLKQQGWLDAVGLQMHISADANGKLSVNTESIQENIQRFNLHGIKVYISELDISIPADAIALVNQKSAYSTLVSAVCNQLGVKSINTWGVVDEVRPNQWLTGQRALPYYTNFAPKPAYFGIQLALGGSGIDWGDVGANGLFNIKSNRNQNAALNIIGGNLSNATRVELYDLSSHSPWSSQQWRIVPNFDGTYSILSSVNDAMALNVTNGLTVSGNDVEIYNRTGLVGNQSFKFMIIADGNGVYHINAVNGNGVDLALHCRGGLTTNSTRAEVYDYLRFSTDQQWVITPP